MKDTVAQTPNAHQSEEGPGELSRREEAIMDHTACVLCGSDLTFTHKVDRELKFVSEQGSCPACRIHLKTKYFAMH